MNYSVFFLNIGKVDYFALILVSLKQYCLWNTFVYICRLSLGMDERENDL